MSKKRKGTKPARPHKNAPAPAPPVSDHDTHPSISFRFIQNGWGTGQLTDKQRQQLLHKWEQRCAITWKDLGQHPKHGLGSEFLPVAKIKPQIPPQFQGQDRVRVYRHEGNGALAGFKVDSIFYILWIEAKFGDLYDHS